MLSCFAENCYPSVGIICMDDDCNDNDVQIIDCSTRQNLFATFH